MTDLVAGIEEVGCEKLPSHIKYNMQMRPSLSGSGKRQSRRSHRLDRGRTQTATPHRRRKVDPIDYDPDYDPIDYDHTISLFIHNRPLEQIKREMEADYIRWNSLYDMMMGFD